MVGQGFFGLKGKLIMVVPDTINKIQTTPIVRSKKVFVEIINVTPDIVLRTDLTIISIHIQD